MIMKSDIDDSRRDLLPFVLGLCVRSRFGAFADDGCTRRIILLEVCYCAFQIKSSVRKFGCVIPKLPCTVRVDRIVTSRTLG